MTILSLRLAHCVGQVVQGHLRVIFFQVPFSVCGLQRNPSPVTTRPTSAVKAGRECVCSIVIAQPVTAVRAQAYGLELKLSWLSIASSFLSRNGDGQF